MLLFEAYLVFQTIDGRLVPSSCWGLCGLGYCLVAREVCWSPESAEWHLELFVFLSGTDVTKLALLQKPVAVEVIRWGVKVAPSKLCQYCKEFGFFLPQLSSGIRCLVLKNTCPRSELTAGCRPAPLSCSQVRVASPGQVRLGSWMSAQSFYLEL